MRQNRCAPASVRKQPEIFCCNFTIRRVSFGLVVIKGHAEVRHEAQHLLLSPLRPQQ